MFHRNHAAEWTPMWAGNRRFQAGNVIWCYSTRAISGPALRRSAWWTEAQHQDCWWKSCFSCPGIWFGMSYNFSHFSLNHFSLTCCQLAIIIFNIIDDSGFFYKKLIIQFAFIWFDVVMKWKFCCFGASKRICLYTALAQKCINCGNKLNNVVTVEMWLSI